MNINDFKMDDNIYRVRDSIKSKCETLDKLSKEICDFTKPIVKRKSDEMIRNFKDFFTGHGFEIKTGSQGAICATNEISEFEFLLYGLDETSAHFKLMNRDKNIYEDLHIRGNTNSEKQIRYKNDSGLYRFRLDNFEVNGDTDLEQLKKMDKAADENIEWYKKTIEQLYTLEFVYCSESGNEFKDFEDFFEKI